MLKAFNLLVLALAALCLSATLFLVYLYKAGQPFGFTLSIALAAGFALLPPLIALWIAQRVPALRTGQGTQGLVFILTTLVAAVGLGIAIF